MDFNLPEHQQHSTDRKSMEQRILKIPISPRRKNKWGVPLVIMIILIIVMSSFELEVTPNLLFLGVYTMIVYNIWYYRKINNSPGIELLITLPFGVIGIVLQFPAHLLSLFQVPAFLLTLGSEFILFAVLFTRQEHRKRKRCNVLTIATVIDNEKKLTRLNRRYRKIATYGTMDAYSYSPVVSYYVNSEPRESTYPNGFAKPIPKGTKVEIKYNNQDPDEFCFADTVIGTKREQPLRLAAIIFMLLGLAMTAVTVMMLLRAFSQL